MQFLAKFVLELVELSEYLLLLVLKPIDSLASVLDEELLLLLFSNAEEIINVFQNLVDELRFNMISHPLERQMNIYLAVFPTIVDLNNSSSSEIHALPWFFVIVLRLFFLAGLAVARHELPLSLHRPSDLSRLPGAGDSPPDVLLGTQSLQRVRARLLLGAHLLLALVSAELIGVISRILSLDGLALV